MAESVLVVGYDYDEFRELQDAGTASGIVCDRADSPAELVRLVQAKRYNCIFCDISILDSVPYIHAIRKIQVTPIIIGAIEEGVFATGRTNPICQRCTQPSGVAAPKESGHTP